MTHFHCRHCHRRVLVEHHAERAWCPACGQRMRPGVGRSTRPIPPHTEPPRTDPPRNAEALP